jgi:hypothetical protein
MSTRAVVSKMSTIHVICFEIRYVGSEEIDLARIIGFQSHKSGPLVGPQSPIHQRLWDE